LGCLSKTAFELKCWNPRFLLHDVDKMIIFLFLFRAKVSFIHRIYSTHHIRNSKVIDKMAAVVDWESSRRTKSEKSLTAREFLDKFHPELNITFNPIFIELGI